MFIVAVYDINTETDDGKNRLQRISKTCLNYGQRVQYSVFEINIPRWQWVYAKQKIIEQVDLKKDSVRFYYLGSDWRKRIEHMGQKKSVDFDEPLIV